MTYYCSNCEWLVIDKVGDFHYFKSILEIGKAYDLTFNEVHSVITYCLKWGDRHSPSRGIYIQRLFNCLEKPPRDYKKFPFTYHFNKYYHSLV